MSMFKVNAEAPVVEVVERVSKWIPSPRVVIGSIADIEYGTSKVKGTPFIKLQFRASEPTKDLKNADTGNCQIAENQYYISEKTMEKDGGINPKHFFKVLADKLGMSDAFVKAMDEVESAEGFADALRELFVGVEFAAAIGGEQVWMKDKNTGEFSEWIKPMVAHGRSFCRPATEEGVAELTGLVKKNLDSYKYLRRNPKPADTGVVEDTPDGDDDSDW